MANKHELKVAKHKIIESIKVHGYTYSFNEICKIYKDYYLKNSYISFTADILIKECKKEFETIFGK